MPTDPGPSVKESIARVRELGILPVVELADLKQAEPLFEALVARAAPCGRDHAAHASRAGGDQAPGRAYPKGS